MGDASLPSHPANALAVPFFFVPHPNRPFYLVGVELTAAQLVGELGNPLYLLGGLPPLWMGLVDEADEDANIRVSILPRVQLGDRLCEKLSVSAHLSVDHRRIIAHNGEPSNQSH